MTGFQVVWASLSLICAACLCRAKTLYIDSSNFTELVEEAARGDFSFDVVLMTDINASALTLPLGTNSEGTCARFSGIFDGGNHVINGAKITGEKVGLFCGMKNAVVKNLIISETCSFSGQYVGGLLGFEENSEINITIQNVINKATIDGSMCASGFVGRIVKSPSATLVFEDCVNYGSVIIQSGFYGSAFFTSASEGNIKLLMNRCKNYGSIIASGEAYSRYVGGMLGTIERANSATIQLTDCVNNGDLDITVKSGMVVGGGIIGYLYSQGTINMTNNVNNGGIRMLLPSAQYSEAFSGGLIGRISGSLKQIAINDNINNGQIRTEGVSKCVRDGGLIGYFHLENCIITMNNNINNGRIDLICSIGNYVSGIGGLIGYYACPLCNASHIHNINNGHISVKASGKNESEQLYVGGYAGCIGDFSKQINSDIQINSGVNEGDVVVTSSSISTSFAAGLIGFVDWTDTYILNCENEGNIQCNSDVCGLVCGKNNPQVVAIINGVNKGNLNGNNSFGISPKIDIARNVVSAGRIESVFTSYSIGENVLNTSYIYVLKGNCEKCNNEQTTFITFDQGNDEYYYSPDGKRLDIHLNEFAEVNHYTPWSPESRLCYGDVCIIVTSGDVIKKKRDVKCGKKIGEMPQISQFLGREGYVVSDVLNNDNILVNDTEISCYMHISIYHVTEKPYIVISIDPIPIELIDKEETLKVVSDQTGINKDFIMIDFTLDGKGNIIEVLMYLDTIEEAEQIAAFVSECRVDH